MAAQPDTQTDNWIRTYSAQYNVPYPIARGLFYRESSYNPRATSSAGAEGLGQLMPGTAREVGVSNPYDPQQNIRGSMQYLSGLYHQFGNWNQALSAYNSGPGNVPHGGGLAPGTQGYVSNIMSDAQSLGYAQPSAADLARNRHNQRTDAHRREGTQLRSQAQVQATTPQSGAVNISPLQVPQYTPPPAYTPPTFTPAQYKQPNKGLEYLAAGISLLFPGAPIAHAAAGLMGGMQQGAQQGYERREKQAEQQYQVQEQGARAAYEAALDKSKADFENAQLKYQQASEMRSRGLNADGTPLPLPTPQSLLPRSIDPHTHAVTVDTSYGSMASAYQRAAQIAAQSGATVIAQQYDTTAREYNQRAIDQANNDTRMATDIYNQNAQDRREQSREDSMFARESQTEAAAQARESQREDREDAREQARLGSTNAQHMGALRDQALKASQDFYSSWNKAIRVPVDANGNPRQDANGNALPPAIPPERQRIISSLFLRIDRATDPADAAQHYSDTLEQNGLQGLDAGTQATVKELLAARGRSADLTRRSKGLPITPNNFAPVRPRTTAKPKFGAPPGLPQGARFVGPGPQGGDLYQFPDGSQHEWKP